MAEVLLVSKPVSPPWTDGAKNLVRHLLTHASGRHSFRCMVPKGSAAPGAHAMAEEVYSNAGDYAPGISQNLRVLWRLIRPDNAPIYHFFFAPNPRTNRIAKSVFALKKRKVVHTVVSKPSGNPPWFADVHVVLSEARRQQLEKSGARDVRIIHPGIPAITLPTRAQKAEARRKLGIDPVQPVVLFAGDLTESGGADHLARAIPRVPDALFVFACRAKGQGHAERQERLASDLGSRALWLGEVADMGSLVATADLHCLPADSLAAKMDLPMVVLESLRSGVPAVVTDAPPMNEMGGSESGVICVPHGDARALAETLTTLLSDPAQRKTLGQAGQQCVTDRYTATAMVRAYDDLYDELDSRSTKE